MPEGGDITIRAYEKNAHVCVAFSDSGPGIDKKQSHNLFVPFKSTKHYGVGIGLVIAHKIIERHGGTITVESEKGRGSTFIVSLPKHRIE